MDQLKFAVKIKEARKAKNMTQKELASHLQVTDKAVSKWERALSFPDIELLAPLSKELDIPLTELLEMEDLAVEDNQSETVETLLHKMMPLMKERVRQEVKRKKKWMYVFIAIIVSVTVLVVGYDEVRTWYRYKEYAASEHIISYEELTINQIEENENRVLLNISVPEETTLYDVYTKIWYDKENTEIAYIQFMYYEKQWMKYDSVQEYIEYHRQGEKSLEYIEEFPMPVEKIIYYDTQEHVLWENTKE